MVHKDPFGCHPERSLAFIIRFTSLGEIPHSTSSCNNELGTCYYESANPEQSKQVVNPNISSNCIPLDFSKGHTVSFDRITSTEDKDC